MDIIEYYIVEMLIRISDLEVSGDFRVTKPHKKLFCA